MKRSEVKTRNGDPTVCVKYYGDLVLGCPLPRNEFGDMTWEWIDSRKESERSAWWEWACEDGWRRAQETAHDIFGERARVYSDGRSGGWCVVHGLAPLDTWSAPELARWARFTKAAAAGVADLAYLYAWTAWANGWEPDTEDCADGHERDSLAGPATHRGEGSAAD